MRSRAQRAVNHLMYGQRDEPAGVLAELGERLQSVLLPADVATVIVDTIARSLRVPYVGLDVLDADGGLHLVAERGVERGPMHAEPLLHHGAEVGRLRVSGRGPRTRSIPPTWTSWDRWPVRSGPPSRRSACTPTSCGPERRW